MYINDAAVLSDDLKRIVADAMFENALRLRNPQPAKFAHGVKPVHTQFDFPESADYPAKRLRQPATVPELGFEF